MVPVGSRTQISTNCCMEVGTSRTAVGALLFAALNAADPRAADLFIELVRRGPGAPVALARGDDAMLRAEIEHAFSLAFLAVAGFTGGGALLAWSMPVRRI